MLMSDQVEMQQYNPSVLQLYSLSLYMITHAPKHNSERAAESTCFLGLVLTKVRNTNAYILQNIYCSIQAKHQSFYYMEMRNSCNAKLSLCSTMA